MSKLAVEVLEVLDVLPHPNADRLDLITVLGWQCIVQKDTIKAGDLVVYFPIDSVLTEPLMDKLFGSDAKVKPSGNRIRTIKLRGAISQGLAVPIKSFSLEGGRCKVGCDLTEYFGVTKWEPPITKSTCSNLKPAPKKNQNENFSKYTDIEHLKKYPKELEGKEVVVPEKIHGTNFRAGWCERPARSLWERIKERFGFWNDKWEFCWGSHNVQLQRKKGKMKTYHYETAKTDVYTEAVIHYQLESILPKGFIIYGEIYGDGIQKNYMYGCKTGERKAIFFDVKHNGKYMSPPIAESFFDRLCLPQPPVLYKGIFDMQKMEELVTGKSVLCPEQPIREGIVIKPYVEQDSYMGRLALKFLNPEYLLLKDNTENH